MTQPAVSQHIQDLEASLGAQLFLRGRRGVTLTPAGETLYGFTRAILGMVAEAESAVTDVTQLADGHVSIAATPGVGVYRLPEWIQHFRTQYPNLTVELQTSTTPQIIANLRSGQVNLGLIEGEVDGVDWAQLGMLELEIDEQFVIVGPKHPWWKRDGVSCKELNHQSFIMRQPKSQTRIWLDGRLAAAQIQVGVVAEFDNVESIKRAVVKGMGITILPEYAVQSELEIGLLHAIPIEGSPMQRTLKLVWNRDLYFSPVTRTFLRFLSQYLPRLAEMKL
jgi:LysR family transcriptional regulator, low CO2-responsive transcriptional regulator